jgi:GntR family transcriptional repressor for pyruvate dehydrogenase complex
MTSDLILAPPKKTTVVDSIIEQIVTKIRDGELKSGDRLPPERELIDMLSVGRSSVREALKGLAAMGVVETRPGEGTFVKKYRRNLDVYESNIVTLSETLQKEMRHYMNQARFCLETSIVTLAAENITQETAISIHEAWETLSEFEDDAMLNHQPMNWEIHDKFHLSIAEAGGNPFLTQLLNLLLGSIPESLRDRNLSFGDIETRLRVLKANHLIHENLGKSVIQGDAPLARKWIKQHADFEELNINQSCGNEVLKTRRAFEDALHDLLESAA